MTDPVPSVAMRFKPVLDAAPDAMVITDRLGRIAPGCRADLVALDPARVKVLATWVAGDKDE